MKYAFLTDIHLDCLNDKGLSEFIDRCTSHDVDGYLISGDISTASTLISHLEFLTTTLKKSINFCLGNHDFWYGSIETTRRAVSALTCDLVKKYEINYVSDYRYYVLSPTTALVGHDGWYDALNGDGKNSNFMMNDWFNIKEYSENLDVDYTSFGPRISLESRFKIIEISQALASEAVTRVLLGLRDAVGMGFKEIVVLTHVPPWSAAHVHEGRPGSLNAMPWFTSKLMGDALEEFAEKHSDVNFTVLCGHTHGRTTVRVSDNVICHVGHSDYVNPDVQFVLDV